MLIREFSDLHNEFTLFGIPKFPEDKDTILILAGDIDLVKYAMNLYNFLGDASERFRAVLYVAGNHESYRGSLIRTHKKIQELIDGTSPRQAAAIKDLQLPDNAYPALPNVHLLEDSKIAFDDVLFVGATLWTNFHNGDPMAMQVAQGRMNDFQIIRYGPHNAPYQNKFTPYDSVNIHIKSKNFIFDIIREEKDNYRKIVVISHHAPTLESIHPRYKVADGLTYMLNYAYASDLSEQILDTQPDLWFHGHVHDTFDYMVGDTRVIANTRGYVPSEPNFKFDPLFRLDI